MPSVEKGRRMYTFYHLAGSGSGRGEILGVVFVFGGLVGDVRRGFFYG